jgi:hypothetical protein
MIIIKTHITKCRTRNSEDGCSPSVEHPTAAVILPFARHCSSPANLAGRPDTQPSRRVHSHPAHVPSWSRRSASALPLLRRTPAATSKRRSEYRLGHRAQPQRTSAAFYKRRRRSGIVRVTDLVCCCYRSFACCPHPPSAADLLKWARLARVVFSHLLCCRRMLNGRTTTIYARGSRSQIASRCLGLRESWASTHYDEAQCPATPSF